ncbi:hypothetical protein [Alicyclobacillus macrosporangiidus]|uniref:hypothetical protein n=1 Tax=Alicyclobacillus macrosporangiidus TaxID=392015 RepID=UPI00049700BC|nr:hypothetical protein [Alicyclobacillus macrosporangiidus]MCL6598955.1 hypothetical protein [Alicyclobacillus macrosporangiidus]
MVWLIRLQWYEHYFTRVIPAASCDTPLTIPCTHGCDKVIQFLSPHDLAVIHQLCLIEAERMAESVLEQIHVASCEA